MAGGGRTITQTYKLLYVYSHEELAIHTILSRGKKKVPMPVSLEC